MRSRTAPDLGGRCPRCYLPDPCLCPDLPHLRPRTELVIIRHMLERQKSTNSARWARAAIPGSELHEWGMEGERLEVENLVVPGTVVLFPASGPTPPPREAPRRLIVVDGSWSQARRILQRSPALRSLPRLSLPPPPPRVRLRSEKLAEGMSTLEAIAGAYTHLGEAEVGSALLEVFEKAVAKSVKIRGRRTV